MANETRLPGDLTVPGTLKAVTYVGIGRSSLTTDSLSVFPIPFADLRVWDAQQTNLPGTSASDDLGFYGGTFGSGAPLIRTYDVKAASAQTMYARFQTRVPAEFVAAGTLKLRLAAGMVTTVAGTSATVDVECYKVNKDNSIGSDLCATNAQSINSLTFANKDFTITSSGLSPGDVLDVRITVATNDAATATAVIAAIAGIDLLADIKG